MINLVLIPLIVAGFRFSYRKLKSLGFFTKKTKVWRTPPEDQTIREMEEKIFDMFNVRNNPPKKKAFSTKVRNFDAVSAWNSRPHLKEESHVCGFVKPGVWGCRCGDLECSSYLNLFGGTMTDEPAHPVPNRRAAIAHSRKK
jgi:hypothetical protein